MTFDIEMVLARPCTSYWLRDALKSALARDRVNALADAETLVALLRGVLLADTERDGGQVRQNSRGD